MDRLGLERPFERVDEFSGARIEQRDVGAVLESALGSGGLPTKGFPESSEDRESRRFEEAVT